MITICGCYVEEIGLFFRITPPSVCCGDVVSLASGLFSGSVTGTGIAPKARGGGFGLGLGD